MLPAFTPDGEGKEMGWADGEASSQNKGLGQTFFGHFARFCRMNVTNMTSIMTLALFDLEECMVDTFGAVFPASIPQ